MSTLTTPQPPQRATPRPSGVDARARLLAGIAVTERTLDLAGIATNLIEGGGGPPIVLLHGPGEHAAKWWRVLPDLIAVHRVIAPDLPGHGNTAANEGPLPVDRVLAWLDELIVRTCATPPVLVGHVLGGAIAARYASVRPDRIRSLVLVDALGLAPFAPSPEFGMALTDFVTEPNETTHDRLWERCAADLDGLRRRLGDSWEILKAYNLERMRVPELGPVQHGLMEQFGMPAIAPEELARIHVPTALIWGRHDQATALRVAEEASQRYGWPLRIIDEVGDDPAIERPAAFVAALRASLEAG